MGEEVDGWDRPLGQTQTGWGSQAAEEGSRAWWGRGGGVIMNEAFVYSLTHTLSGKADG